MDFRDDQEEEDYVRRIARPMQVHPDRVAELLHPLGFFLTYANRRDGVNSINFLRPPPSLECLFEGVHLDSNIPGESCVVTIGISALPHLSRVFGVSEYVPATRYGNAREDANLDRPGDARQFERRLAAALPGLFAQLH